MNARNLPFAVLLVATLATTGFARKWTDVSGKFSREADFVEVKEANAILKLTDGKLIPVPLERLCAADREFIESKLKPITDPKPADFAGTWKTKSLFVKGKLLDFSNLEMTFEPDGKGKGKAVYRAEQGGGQFAVTASEFVIEHTKVKDEKTNKETTLTHIEGLAGIQWILTLESRTKLRLMAIYPTESGPGVESFDLTKDPN